MKNKTSAIIRISAIILAAIEGLAIFIYCLVFMTQLGLWVLVIFPLGAFSVFLTVLGLYATAELLDNTEEAKVYNVKLFDLLGAEYQLKLKTLQEAKETKAYTVKIYELLSKEKEGESCTEETVEVAEVAEEKPSQRPVNQEETYLFAVNMMKVNNYEVAYRAFEKIKGYKDVDQLMEQLKEKI